MKNSTLAAKLIVSTTFGIAFMSALPAANAGSLIPSTEGEVKLTNMACGTGNTCIDTQAKYGYSVTSLAYKSGSTTYQASRLFVDKGSTANTWNNGNTGFKINFGMDDAGTNPDRDESWFRPVAYNKDGSLAEGGALEVGKFKFDFQNVLSEISLDFFDIEKSGISGAIQLNGNNLLLSSLLKAGVDGNHQSITLNNVKSLVLQLGYNDTNSYWKDGTRKTGDGVRLAGLQSVPESSTNVSLGLLALAGMFGVSQSKKAAKAA